MNRGLLEKTAREAWRLVLLCCLGALLYELLAPRLVWKFQEEMMGPILRLDFVQNLVRATLGLGGDQPITPRSIIVIAWVHPIILTILWGQAVYLGTRHPVSEVERGTIDSLLSLPVTRWSIHAHEAFVVLVGGVCVAMMALAGHWTSCLALPPAERFAFARMLIVTVNLLGVYVAVWGLACLLSTLVEQRDRAVGVTLVILLASYLVGFLGQFWEPARAVDFLGIMSYYQPFETLNTGRPPWFNLAILYGVGLGAWLAGGAIFHRRDIHTV